MSGMTEEDWVSFHALVDDIGHLVGSWDGGTVVFRSGSEPITIEDVRRPYRDAVKMAKMLDDDPEFIEDTGFHTVLPLAKSLEMHLRLVFMGDEPSRFHHKGFHATRCLRTMKELVEGYQTNPPSFNAAYLDGEVITAQGEYWNLFSIAAMNGTSNDFWGFWKRSHGVYLGGHEFRHSKVTRWDEVKSVYLETLQSFEVIMGQFDRLISA